MINVNNLVSGDTLVTKDRVTMTFISRVDNVFTVVVNKTKEIKKLNIISMQSMGFTVLDLA